MDKFHDAAAVSFGTPPKPASMNNNTTVRKTSKTMLLSSKDNGSSRTPRGRSNNRGGDGCRVGRSGQKSAGRTRDQRGGEVTGTQTPTTAPINPTSTTFMSEIYEEKVEGKARKGARMSSATACVRPPSEKDKGVMVPSASSLRLARETKTPTTATSSAALRKTITGQHHQQRPNRQQQAYKREVRARRKAKERARRHARSADGRGQGKYNAESGYKQSADSKSTDDRGSPRKIQNHNAPKSLLEPIAPTLLEDVTDKGGEGFGVGYTGVGRTIDEIGDASDETNTHNTSAIVDWSDAKSVSQGDVGGVRPLKAAEALIACDANKEQCHEQWQGRRQNGGESEHCSEYGDDFEDDASIPLSLDKA